MKFKTFEIVEKEITRIQTCLEVDTTLDKFERADLRDVLDILVKLYENSKPSNAS
jgi:hypothetical protein